MTTKLEKIHLRALARRLIPGLEHKYQARFAKFFTEGSFRFGGHGPRVLWAERGKVSVDTPPDGLQVDNMVESTFGEDNRFHRAPKVRFISLADESYNIDRVTVEICQANSSAWEVVGDIFKLANEKSVNARIVRRPAWKIGDVHHEARGAPYVVVHVESDHAILWGGPQLMFQVAHATIWEPGYEDWVNASEYETEYETWREASELLRVITAEKG